MGRALDPLTQLEATKEDYRDVLDRCEEKVRRLKATLRQHRKEIAERDDALSEKDAIIEAARKVAKFPCHRGGEPLHRVVRDLREELESRGIPAD